ncbi:MAG: methionyl-tRNA formyltransferase [Oscillospiraceae bacterium]|nr:methionyl-tRNA formyltransferase [Oscillospiraceae bacterium]
MRIVFMGTPEFAVPPLQMLIDSRHEVTAVFTQPDKPKNRGHKLTPPPVKELAVTHDIPVYQPVSLRGDQLGSIMEILDKASPDVIVVAAYGQILPKEVLDMPRFGCINIHSSLLPKYRGAGPIQWAVINGEKETGVTSMLMAEGLDTGDMLVKRSTPIGENETADELHDRLAVMGAEVLSETLDRLENGTLVPEKQDDSLSTYAPKLTKELCPIDFSLPARQVHNRICGLSSWPCATTEINGRRLKVFRSQLKGKKYDLPAGTIADKTDLTFVCGDGYGVTFTEVQADSGKRMKTADFLRGNHI